MRRGKEGVPELSVFGNTSKYLTRRKCHTLKNEPPLPRIKGPDPTTMTQHSKNPGGKYIPLFQTIATQQLNLISL